MQVPFETIFFQPKEVRHMEFIFGTGTEFLKLLKIGRGTFFEGGLMYRTSQCEQSKRSFQLKDPNK